MSISGHPSEWGNYIFNISATTRVPRRVSMAQNKGSRGWSFSGGKGGGSVRGHPSEWGKMNLIIPATLRVPRGVPLAQNRGVSRVVKLRRKGGWSLHGHPSEWGKLIHLLTLTVRVQRRGPELPIGGNKGCKLRGGKGVGPSAATLLNGGNINVNISATTRVPQLVSMTQNKGSRGWSFSGGIRGWVRSWPPF